MPKQASELDPAQARKVLILAFAATVSMVMGVSSIVPLVPMLSRTFGVSLPSASLVITLFTLPGIAFTLVSGVLADRYGRRAVLVPSLVLYSLAGSACALAPDFNALLALRFLQGVGSSALGILSTTMIADVWSGKSLARMIGYNMSVLSVSAAVYPSVGGFLASFDWRLPFLLPVLVLPTAFLALRTPLAGATDKGTFRDYLSGMNRTLHDSRILALLGMTLITFIMQYGPLITCFPAYADARFGASPGVIGAMLIVSSLGMALMASQLGRLRNRFSSRNLLLCSQALYMVSLSLMPNLPWLGLVLLPVLCYGLGQGLNVPNVQTQLLEAAPSGQRASILAANAMVLRLGQTIAPVTFSAVMVSYGMAWGFYGGIGLAVLLSLLALRYHGNKPANQEGAS